jgi:hypothetical protein
MELAEGIHVASISAATENESEEAKDPTRHCYRGELEP